MAYDPEQRRVYDRERRVTPKFRASLRARYASDPEFRERRRATVRKSMQAYNRSFAGVVSRHRYEERQALARLTQQVTEGFDSL